MQVKLQHIQPCSIFSYSVSSLRKNNEFILCTVGKFDLEEDEGSNRSLDDNNGDCLKEEDKSTS